MRRRAWVAWGALALAIILGILGRVLPGASGWNLAAGLALATALLVGVTLLPIARTIAPSLAPMPGLFERPRPNERWCASCGRPTGAAGPCRHCGTTLPARPRAR